MIRVLLDGVEPANQPEGVSELTERWEQEEELPIYSVEITGPLTFFGEDFTYFFNTAKASPCTIINVELHQKRSDTANWMAIFKGVIFVNDIDFDLDRRLAVCEIVDDGIFARIINNSTVSIDLSWISSKNGVPVSATINHNVSIKDQNNVTRSNRRGVKLYDAFVFMLAWMTDDDVLFESEFLTTDPEASSYYLMAGKTIRNGTVSLPKLTFRNLLSDAHKIFHLYGYSYRNQQGRVVFKVEPYEFFEQNSQTLTFGDFKEFKLTTNQKTFISAIDFGSFKNLDVDASEGGVSTDIWFIESFNGFFAGWSNEDTITLDIKCNNTVKLNLKNEKLITDPNVISAAANNGSETEYDQDVFMVQDETHFVALPVYPLDPNTFLAAFGSFNYSVSNREVLRRWLNVICFDSPQYSQSSNNYMRADVNADYVAPDNHIAFDTKTDLYGYIVGTGTEQYAAVNFGSSGGGIFNIRMRFVFRNDTGVDFPIRLSNNGFTSTELASGTYAPYYALGYLTPSATGWTDSPFADYGMAQYVDATIPAGGTLSYEAEMRNVVFYEGGTYQICGPGITTPPILAGITILAGSFWEVVPVVEDVFLFGTDNCDVYNYELSATGLMSYDEIGQFRNNQFAKIFLPHQFRNYTGKRTSLERNIVTGETNLKILSKHM